MHCTVNVGLIIFENINFVDSQNFTSTNIFVEKILRLYRQPVKCLLHIARGDKMCDRFE